MAAEEKGGTQVSNPYQLTQVSERHQDCENSEDAPSGQPPCRQPHLAPPLAENNENHENHPRTR